MLQLRSLICPVNELCYPAWPEDEAELFGEVQEYPWTATELDVRYTVLY